MADDSQAAATPTPTKRKRKSELEKLLEDRESAPKATSTVTDDNPWTPRENLELLRIHRDYHNLPNPKQKVARLNDMMSRIRDTASKPQLPARTEKEFMSQLRKLKNKGVEIEDLEAEVFPSEETPRKKRKKAAAVAEE